MNVLYFDTSISGVHGEAWKSVDGDWLLSDRRCSKDHFGSATECPIIMSQLIKALDNQVDGLIVGEGPGTFTGLKVGMAFLFGWRAARQDPPAVVGVSPLGMMARRHEGHLVCLKATKAQGYGAYYDSVSQDTRWYRVEPDNKGKLMVHTAVDGVECPRMSGEPAILVNDWEAFPGDCPRIMGETMREEISLCVKHELESDCFRNAQDTMPRPRYLRRSAPEERGLR